MLEIFRWGIITIIFIYTETNIYIFIISPVVFSGLLSVSEWNTHRSLSSSLLRWDGSQERDHWRIEMLLNTILMLYGFQILWNFSDTLIVYGTQIVVDFFIVVLDTSMNRDKTGYLQSHTDLTRSTNVRSAGP